MADIKWFRDEQAKQVHTLMDEHLKIMCQQLFPNHLFTHSGWNRNDFTNEIVIKLHLRPIGEAMLINERLNRPDRGLLEKP